MDRRHNARVSVQLPAQVWGLNAFGQAFTDSALVVNISFGGIVLRGVNRRIRIGELLDVRIENSNAQFRVIWIGPTGDLGLQNLTAETFLPKAVLLHCAQAAAACWQLKTFTFQTAVYSQRHFYISCDFRFGGHYLRIFSIVPGILIFASLIAAQENRNIQLMPWPSNIKTTAGGQLVIQNSFSVGLQNNDPRLRKTAEIFLNDLRRHTGSLPLDFAITDQPGQAQLRISSQHPSKEVQELGEDESYKL
jgi:hypothetical protein